MVAFNSPLRYNLSMLETKGYEMATFRETMEGYGYIAQTTPAGRVIMVSPAAYPLSNELLANEDDYADFLDEAAGKNEAYDDDRDWGMEAYDDQFALED